MTFMRKIMDMLKMDDETPINPNAQTIYFRDGKLYKVYPTDEESWYDARYLVSDGKTYDLENVHDIQRIPIPRFSEHDSMMEAYGVTGLLDYVIRMKAGALYNRNEKELCSACLWKSTELMFSNKSCAWRKSDYTRLIKWHLQLGMEEEAEKARIYLEKKGIIFTEIELKQYKSTPRSTPKERKFSKKDTISYKDKELAIVKRVTTEDMKSLKNMPFVCNTEVKKFIQQGGHSFAYMDIVGENIKIVKSEIEKMNVVIKQDLKKYKTLPRNLEIPVNQLVFSSKDYGYTRIMCNPKTYSGKPSKYPYSLFFATDFSKMATGGDTTHGELFYGQNGEILKGNIYFWRKGKPTFLTYKTIDENLTLSDIE